MVMCLNLNYEILFTIFTIFKDQLLNLPLAGIEARIFTAIMFANEIQ